MRICADATGLGAGVASWLASALGESAVERFVLTAPAKSKLGFDLLGMAGTGRCRVYGRDDAAESRQVWLEIDEARYQLAANEQMRFYVPENEGHDDYLMSLALRCQAAQEAMPPAASALVAPRRAVW